MAGAAACTMQALDRAQPAAGAPQRGGLPGRPAAGLALQSAEPDPHLSLRPGDGDVPGEPAVGQRVRHDLARLARVRVVEQARVHRPARGRCLCARRAGRAQASALGRMGLTLLRLRGRLCRVGGRAARCGRAWRRLVASVRLCRRGMLAGCPVDRQLIDPCLDCTQSTL